MENSPQNSGQGSAATKERILDAAEQLFGDLGYAATSLRAVTGRAGVNLAAVHYYFGSKIGLFEAVFQRRVTTINEERLLRLKALQETDSPPPSLEDVLRAFLEPAFLRVTTDDPTWPRFQRFIGRVMSEPGEHTEAVREVFREVQLRFFPVFQEILPHLSEADVFWRIHLVVGTLCNLLTDPARIGVLSEGRCDGTDADETVAQLVAFAAGGLRAPAAVDVGTPKPGVTP